MRIGIVKHLNARPLTYGFEKKGSHTLVYDNPSVLVDYLLRGDLDLALISSVECLRNENFLDYSLSTGVCSAQKVRSILYFENKREDSPFARIHVDSGSRSSVALLKILIAARYAQIPTTLATPSTEIQKMIENGIGSHLLFGDNALLAKWDPDQYTVYDLATLWNEATSHFFCFALWAYPKNQKIESDLFYSSLEYGLQNIDEIISNEHRFSEDMIREYLLKELHYVLTEKDKEGFEEFRKRCMKYGLI